MSLTLVVLAAGMGSRYGGLKQLDPVGRSGEVLQKPCKDLRAGMVAYSLPNMLSGHGAVSRGICTVGRENQLLRVEEHTGIERRKKGIRGLNLAGEAVTLSRMALENLYSSPLWKHTQ